MGHQVQKIRRLKGQRRGSNMLIRGAPDKLNKEKRGGEIIKQIINTFFLQQGIISQVKIIHQVSSRMNEKRPIPEHIIVHFQILEVREENLNAFRHEIEKRELKWPLSHSHSGSQNYILQRTIDQVLRPFQQHKQKFYFLCSLFRKLLEYMHH